MQESKYICIDGPRSAPTHTESYYSLEVRKTLRGDSGLFTLEDIRSGATVGHDGGEVVSSVEDVPPHLRYAVLISADRFLAPRNYHQLDSFWFLNHSCEANIARIGGLIFVAKRDIAAGEELTIDYSPLIAGVKDWVMECQCTALSCRGHIRGEDWTHAELAKSLWLEWLPHIQKRILQKER